MDAAESIHIMRMLRLHCFTGVRGALVAAPSRRTLADADIARISKAYISSIAAFDAGEMSLWNAIIFPKHKAFHDHLLSENILAIRAILSDPAGSDVLYGFSEVFPESFQAITGSQLNLDGYAHACIDRLLALAAALGVRRSWNPEHPHATDPMHETADSILDQVEQCLGRPLSFPNVFDRNFGIQTERGLLTDRAVHAIYLIHRIETLCSQRGGESSILEIGAGLGYSGYFAHRFGIGRYTIVDIPVTAACQAFFLMSTLGPDAVSLAGETSRHRDSLVRIWSPEEFFVSNETFDLAVNVDSMTEMSRTTARRYLAELQQRVPIVLSINHESNEFSFLDLCREVCGREPQLRMPYWLRRGYVEEHLRAAAVGATPRT
jgi:hypothetical protein